MAKKINKSRYHTSAHDIKTSHTHPNEELVARWKAPLTGIESSSGVNHQEATDPDTVQATTLRMTPQPHAMEQSQTSMRGRPSPLNSHSS